MDTALHKHLPLAGITPEILFVATAYGYPENFCYIEVDIRKEPAISGTMLQTAMHAMVDILQPLIGTEVKIRVLSFDNDHVASWNE